MQNQLGPLCVHQQAYLFFPIQKEQKTEEGKKGSRFFFYGQIEHDEYEKRKIKQFHQFVAKNKVQYNRQFFSDQRVLLFLQSFSYDPKKTLEGMAAHVEFRKQYLPPDFSKVQKIIKSGLFYPCGRDKNFRPVIVFNATLIDPKDLQTGLLASVFVHEEIIKNMFINGQVQNWNIIYDLGGMGISEIPMSALKSVANRIGSNYGGRLFKNALLLHLENRSAFLDPVTVEKIKISKTNTQKTMFDHIDPSQVQKKYGGTQDDRKQFWPFTIPKGVFDEKRLISTQQYEARLKKGLLVNNVIDPKYSQKKE